MVVFPELDPLGRISSRELTGEIAIKIRGKSLLAMKSGFLRDTENGTLFALLYYQSSLLARALTIRQRWHLGNLTKEIVMEGLG